MNVAQHSAAVSLQRALRVVKRAHLALRVFDGHVYVVPEDTNLWPDGPDGDVIAILETHGAEVSPAGLDADGGAGR